ncbi:beta-ketoacyl synthase N-terminal-like domain-containing protein [Streptomyces sp. NPDC050997]|uniref:beta-ketoacyl synthase N-terminal-like domain-containing protein n=1 Tax=Streptomyces sp. NPDC050997 TaxID=3155519 RepID=UPI00341EBA01
MRTPNPSLPPTGAAVTAAGAVTASGTSVAELFEDLLAGRRPFTTRSIPLVSNPLPAAAHSEPGETDDTEVFAAHVQTPLDLTDLVGARAARAMSRDGRLLLYAAHAAGAGLGTGADPDRTGVVLGTLRAGRNEYLAIHNASQVVGGPVNPVWGPQSGYNAPAAQLSIHLPARGPNLTLSSGATAGLDAVAVGVQQVTSSVCDTVVAGGVDTLSPAVPGTNGAGADDVPEGEAAAVVVLRDEHTADRVLARVLGTGRATAAGADGDTDADVMRELVRAADTAIRDALRAAGRLPADVGFAVTVRGGDRAVEGPGHVALQAAFGPKVPVCDATATTGRTGGADGALAVVVAVEALARGVVPSDQDRGAPVAPVGPLALCLGVDPGGSATAVLLAPPTPNLKEAT